MNQTQNFKLEIEEPVKQEIKKGEEIMNTEITTNTNKNKFNVVNKVDKKIYEITFDDKKKTFTCKGCPAKFFDGAEEGELIFDSIPSLFIGGVRIDRIVLQDEYTNIARCLLGLGKAKEEVLATDDYIAWKKARTVNIYIGADGAKVPSPELAKQTIIAWNDPKIIKKMTLFPSPVNGDKGRYFLDNKENNDEAVKIYEKEREMAMDKLNASMQLVEAEMETVPSTSVTETQDEVTEVKEEVKKTRKPRVAKAAQTTGSTPKKSRVSKWNTGAIMRETWRRAKEEATKSGKKSRECFGDACRSVWAEAKQETGDVKVYRK